MVSEQHREPPFVRAPGHHWTRHFKLGRLLRQSRAIPLHEKCQIRIVRQATKSESWLSADSPYRWPHCDRWQETLVEWLYDRKVSPRVTCLPHLLAFCLLDQQSTAIPVAS